MNNNLFYRERVTHASEIKDAYERAVQDNKKYYICIAPNGQYLGWHNNNYITAESARKHYPDIVERINGEWWFVNPKYEGEEIVEAEEPIAEAAEENTVPSVEPTVEPTVEPIIEPVTLEAENKVNTPAVEPTAESKEMERIKGNLSQVTASFEEMQKLYNDTCRELAEAKAEIARKDELLAVLNKDYAKLRGEYEAIDNKEVTAQEQIEELREAIGCIIDFIKGDK